MEAEEPEAILGLAAQHMDQGETAQALATISQGLVRHPDDPRLLEQRADVYATLPSFRSQAAEIYRRLSAQSPGDLALKNKLATTLLALRRFNQAERLFQQVLSIEPDNSEAHLGLGRLYLRSAFYTLAQYHFDVLLPQACHQLQGQRNISFNAGGQDVRGLKNHARPAPEFSDRKAVVIDVHQLRTQVQTQGAPGLAVGETFVEALSCASWDQARGGDQRMRARASKRNTDPDFHFDIITSIIIFSALLVTSAGVNVPPSPCL
jgi:tetratricopeptide (TPR) repeat protein